MGVLAVPLAGQELELRGRVEPAPGKFASVMLHGSDFPFEADTVSDHKGRFKFKNLDAGQYTVIVFLPGRGQCRRTVAVTPSFADDRGRVEVTIPFEATGEAIEASNTVSARALSIPRPAEKEWERAQKRLNKRDVEGAIEHLERAVEIAPHYVVAWNNLGTIAYQSGRYEDAAKYFRTALEHEPGAYSPVVNLGGALLSLGEYREALQYNEYAVKMRPDEALPNSQLGLNWHYLGDQEKAIKFLTSAKRIDPNHFSHPQMTLAKIHALRGDAENAVREMKDFLERHPDSPRAEVVRGWLEQIRQATKQ